MSGVTREPMLPPSIAELSAAMSRGATSAETLAADALAACRARAADNIMITLRDEAAVRADARAVDEARRAGRPLGPLAGIPLIVKDNIAVGGQPFTGGCPAFADHVAAADASVVARLTAAGAIIIGKANLHELAFGATSNNGWAGPVRNPHDPARVAGGSSGGSAAVVATGIVPISLGTDTGGSGRIPAALCGCIGYRPTTGRYPSDGVMLLTTVRDTISLTANHVADIALVDGIVTGAAPAAPVSLDSLRIGVLNPFAGEGLTADVRSAFADAIARLRAAGAAIVPVDGGELLKIDQAIGLPIVLAEARPLWIMAARQILGLSLDAFADRIASPDVQATFRMMAGQEPPVSDGAYRDMRDGALVRLRQAYAEIFAAEGVDLIAFPTVLTTAPPIGEDDQIMIDGTAMPLFPALIRNTGPGSLAGVPGISLPIAVAEGALPVGLALDAPVGGDAGLLAAAAAIERVLAGQVQGQEKEDA